jgi:hypothetical protein
MPAAKAANVASSVPPRLGSVMDRRRRTRQDRRGPVGAAAGIGRCQQGAGGQAGGEGSQRRQQRAAAPGLRDGSQCQEHHPRCRIKTDSRKHNHG